LRSYFEEPLSSREQPYELICLFHCLLITAAARLACADIWDAFERDRISPVIFARRNSDDFDEFRKKLDREKGSAEYTASELIKRLGPAFASWRKQGTPRLRAASASAMAHWARVQRRRAEEAELFISKTPEDQADPLSLLQEALAHEPSAIRHIELAELLNAEGRTEEAERLLRRAQRIAPRHPLPARWLPRH
jgi:tetratricopeptide (TPR) repeat protein